MFNNNSNIRNELNINAVNGMLIKNHPNSFFIRFHMNSRRAEALFTPNPVYDGREIRAFNGLFKEGLY